MVAGSDPATWSSWRWRGSACCGTRSFRVAEIAVVGAGVNRPATAHALARAGRDVVVYEQFEFGHTRGASHGRSRIFRLAPPQAHWGRPRGRGRRGGRGVGPRGRRVCGRGGTGVG